MQILLALLPQFEGVLVPTFPGTSSRALHTHRETHRHHCILLVQEEDDEETEGGDAPTTRESAAGYADREKMLRTALVVGVLTHSFSSSNACVAQALCTHAQACM